MITYHFAKTVTQYIDVRANSKEEAEALLSTMEPDETDETAWELIDYAPR